MARDVKVIVEFEAPKNFGEWVLRIEEIEDMARANEIYLDYDYEPAERQGSGTTIVTAWWWRNYT